MRKIIFIAVLLFVQICFANNDKQILRNQTSRLLSRRQYERVITLYKDWLKDYPNDIEIAGKLVDTYLIVNKIDLAEELYNRYKDSFPAEGKLKFQLLIDLRKGEHKLAFRRVNKFLTVDTPEQEYLALAQLFQENRQYDFAAKLILAAREKSGDNTLYARELALNYYSAEEYEKSIREFFVMLENDERYYYFATSRIRQMLEKDKNLIKVVEKCVYRSNSNKAKEILSVVATAAKENLDYYQRFPSDKKALLMTAIRQDVSLCQEVYRVASQYGLKEMADEMEPELQRYYSTFVQR